MVYVRAVRLAFLELSVLSEELVFQQKPFPQSRRLRSQLANIPVAIDSPLCLPEKVNNCRQLNLGYQINFNRRSCERIFNTFS